MAAPRPLGENRKQLFHAYLANFTQNFKPNYSVAVANEGGGNTVDPALLRYFCLRVQEDWISRPGIFNVSPGGVSGIPHIDIENTAIPFSAYSVRMASIAFISLTHNGHQLAQKWIIKTLPRASSGKVYTLWLKSREGEPRKGVTCFQRGLGSKGPHHRKMSITVITGPATLYSAIVSRTLHDPDNLISILLLWRSATITRESGYIPDPHHSDIFVFDDVAVHHGHSVPMEYGHEQGSTSEFRNNGCVSERAPTCRAPRSPGLLHLLRAPGLH